MSCEAKCPLNIDLPGMILQARKQKRRKRLTLGERLLSKADVLQKMGSIMPSLVRMLSTNTILRWIGEKVMDIKSDRQFPDIKRETFKKWFESYGK